MFLARKTVLGFTTIEVISVLIIMSVVAAVVVSRVSVVPAEISSEAGIIKAHLRFAQYLALSNDLYSYRVTFASGAPDFYSLSKIEKSSGTVTTNINLPNEDSPTHLLPPSINITAGLGDVTFDEWGSPGPANRSITLSDGSGHSETITISQNTGYIP
jgi:MSHA pilin protein MshC